MSEGTPPPPPSDNPYGTGGAPPPPPPPSNQPPPAQPGGYQAAPPPPPPPPAGRRPGELLDRFLARLIDSVLLFVVALVILVPLVIGLFGLDAAGFGMGGSFASGLVTALLSTVINLGYFGLMESTRGQTVGKMLMKLHVVGAGGGNPTLEEAVKRNIWMGLPILGIIPVLGSLVGSVLQLVAVIMIAVQINSDPERKPWTDKFAGTQVIKEG